MADNSKNKSRVEIGVLEECDSYLLESRFFPSKFGGKPAWLDLRSLPKSLNCGVCFNPCVFLCQLYAPIDDKPECHHRTLFLFICPDSKCLKSNENKNLKVFRCQLAARNEFYPVEDPIEVIDWHPECHVEAFSKICSLCGNPAPFTCGKCKEASYCTKEHQVSDWKVYGHKVNCGNNEKEVSIEPSILFPQFEISIETINEENEEYAKSEDDCLREYEEFVKNGTAGGSLSKESAQSLEQYTANVTDKYFAKYKKTISQQPQQILRYDRGGEPLFIAKPTLDSKHVPNCEYCGGERQFEFQVLSTILNELIDIDRWNGIDWGTLIIYSCKNSCKRGPAYKTEYIYKQDVVE